MKEIDVAPNSATLSILDNAQSFKSTLSGSSQYRDLPGARWGVSLGWFNRSNADGRRLAAQIASLNGPIGTFKIKVPDANNQGAFAGAGVVDGAGQTGTVLATKNWTGGQNELGKTGDYIEVNQELKVLTDDATVSDYLEYEGTNYMPSPFDPSGWVTNPDGTAVNTPLENPSGVDFVGIVEQVGSNFFTFCETYNNDLPSASGDNLYASILIKSMGLDFDIALQTQGSNNAIRTLKINALNYSVIQNQSDDYLITDMPNGFKLIQAKFTVANNDPDFFGRFIYLKKNSVSAAPIGSKLYAQAAYFGKNPLTFPYSNYNEFASADEIGAGGWSGVRATLSVSNGLLNYVSTNADPRINKAITYDGSVFNTIKIRWRKNAGDSLNELFWRNDENYGDGKSLLFGETTIDPRVTTETDGDFFISTIYLGGTASYTGALGFVKGVRLDFGFTSGNFDIDYIKIYSPSLKEEYDAFWPARPKHKATFNIAPAIRKSPADGQEVVAKDPSMYLRRASSGAFSSELSPSIAGPLYAFGLEAIEID